MGIIRELYEYRQMIASLVRRDLRGRYKGSFLGFLWTFVNPLLQLLVYSLVFTNIMRVEDVEIYYLYLFIALIPWLFFSNSIAGGAGCILAQKDMVSKIYFPREVIPISHVTSGFINMLLCFIVVIAAVIFAGVEINLFAWLFLPVIFIIQYILVLGITMLVSAITVYFRDLEHILGIVMMAWMYLTPIIYTPNMVPESFKVYFNLNPMTHIVTAYRDILYYGRFPEFSTLISSIVFGIVFLFIGFIAFGRLKRHFAEEM